MKNDFFDAVIVAGGEYPTAPQPLEALQSAPFVVCCDGAADRYIATGGVPDAIVGDGDPSVPPTARNTHTCCISSANRRATTRQRPYVF